MKFGYSKLILLAIIICTSILPSCNRFYALTHKRYPVPTSFDDTLTSIQNRIHKDIYSKYILYTYKSGNCFGRPSAAEVKLFWQQEGISWCRVIKKETNMKNIIDESFAFNSHDFFSEFEKMSLDTVKSFPRPLWFIDPSSPSTIYLQSYPIKFECEFETASFAHQDSTHFMHDYILKIMNFEKPKTLIGRDKGSR